MNKPDKPVILTRPEVSKLPIGSVVRQHTLDKYGYPQTLDIYIMKVKGKKAYCYRTWDYKWEETYLRSFKEDDPYRYYELVKRGDEE